MYNVNVELLAHILLSVIVSTVEPLLKDTPNKGHNRFNVSIKDILCGPYKIMVIQFYLLMRIMY